MSGQKSYGIGDLPAASPVADTDTLAICQNPLGCFATDATVTLKGVSQSQLTTYYRTKLAALAPITYDSGAGNIGLNIDSTLSVVSGQLHVVAGGAGITVPNSPLLGGNGTALTSVAVGTGLSLTAGTLSATAAGGTPGGTAGQVQYNSAGTTFAGSSGAVFSATQLTSLNVGLSGSATGDLYYNSGGGTLARLGIGTAGQVLEVAGGLPAWQTVATGGGTVQSGTGPQFAQYAAGTSTVVAGATLSGDATIAQGGALTLAASGVAAGTYNNLTVNAKGLATGGSNVAYLTSPVAIANGGTGGTTRGTGLDNLFAQSGAAQAILLRNGQDANGGVYIGLPFPLGIAQGGTGALTAPAALTSLGAAPIASPTFTGIPAAPTATAGTNTTQLATTAFVATATGAYVPLAGGVTMTGNLTLPNLAATASVAIGGPTVAGGAASLVINANTVTPPLPPGTASPSGVQLAGANNTQAQIVIDAFGTSPPVLWLRRSDGTAAVPSALQLNDLVGAVRFTGYGATAYATATRGGMLVQAAENWTDTAQGTLLQLQATPATTATAQVVMTLQTGAAVGSPAAPAGGMLAGDLNAQRLLVNGVAVNPGFEESAGWLAGANPHRAVIFTNNTGRTLTLVAITGFIEAVNGTAQTIDVYSAPSGTASIVSGTKRNTASLIANVAGVVAMLSGGAIAINANDRLGIVVAGTPAFDTCVATITCYMQ